MKRQLVIISIVICLAAALAVAQHTLGDYLLSLVCFVGIFAMLAVSLNLTNGFTGLFSLGHPAFMAIGGYTAALLTFPLSKKPLFLPDLPHWLAVLHLPFLPALIIGGLVAALAALIIGIPVLRLRDHYLAVATMGFLIIVQVLIINMDSITRGPLGLNGLDELTNVWWVYGWLAITIYVCWKIKFSSYGRQFIAVRENEMAARCLGINVFGTKLQALVIGAFFAGVAGGLWGHLITALTPNSFSLLLAFTIVVMVVVGGSGSICGSLAGAVLFTVITEFFRPLEENFSIYGIGEIFMALVLIAILVLRPQGLFSCDEPKGIAPRPKYMIKP